VTDEIMAIILCHTNEKILEESYTKTRLRKSPHLKETDLVN
jgi:hypothetical protein